MVAEMRTKGVDLLRSAGLAVFATMLLVLCCGILASCGGGSSSPEDVAKKAGQSYADQNPQAYYSLLAPGYANYVVGQNGWYKTAEEFEDDVIRENMEELHDKFRSRCGDNYKVDISVRTTKTCDSDSTLEKVRSELANNYNYTRDEVQDAVEVEINYRVTGNGTGGDLTQTTNCVKVGGNWYIHRPEIDAL